MADTLTHLTSVPAPRLHDDDRQLVAVFDTNSSAHMARDALIGAGLARTSIHVIDRAAPHPAGSTATTDDRRTALLTIIGSLFSRTESAGQFHLAHEPNHALVIVDHGTTIDHARAEQILRASGPVEIYRCT